MTPTLPDISNKLPAEIVETLKLVKLAASRLNIPILLVGATARDFILNYSYGISTGRATRDIDFGVSVGSWEEYEKLKSTLASTTHFVCDSRNDHRLIASSGNPPVDLIPFGQIETDQGTIIWANENEMNLAGFMEAYNSSLKVKLADDLEIKVISPTGLALLKLVAWSDRQSDKDSEDFWLVAKNYIDLGNTDRFYSQHQDLLEDIDFDLTIAGARLLGRDVGKLLNEQTRKIVSSIFDDPKTLEKFVLEIYRKENRLDNNFDFVSLVLESFSKGLND